jgi:very-short-patch-repair endonuclease
MERRMRQLLESLKNRKFIHSFASQVSLGNTKMKAGFLVNTLDQKVKFVLEMDGSQHFDDTYSASLETAKLHDKTKHTWCKERGVPVLRIAFNVKKEEYESIVLEFLERITTRRGQSETWICQCICKPGKDGSSLYSAILE